MGHVKSLSSRSAILLLLLTYVDAQQSCINTCTNSANVLTQLKSCSGCGTDDWSCFCRCPQYMNALFSCVEQYCTGSDVTDSIVSFCQDQGVGVSYTSGSLSISPSSTSFITSASSSSATGSRTSSVTDASELSAFLASAASTPPTSLAATDTSGISAYLASAVPSTARTESSSACFVNSQYSYYSTPTWYTSLPTQAQSYYSSVNQGNTAACTLTPEQAAALATPSHRRSGLSGGAIAGIVIGAILAALLLAALLWCLLRRRRRQRRNDAAGYNRSRSVEPRSMTSAPANSQEAYLNGKEGLVGSAAPTRHSTVPVVGGTVLGTNNGNKQPNSFSTTTTTRTTIRSKPRNSAPMSQSNQVPRPPPQPISNHTPNDQSPNIPQQSTGRRAF